MSDNTNDSGPAFPVQDMSKWQCPGMSLRDYFAAKAMQALITCSWFSFRNNADKVTPLHQHEGELAEDAYNFADAMLAAREVKS